MELSSSNIKKSLILFQKKAFLIFPGMQPCTYFASPGLKNKKIYPEKTSDTLKNSLYFLKRRCSYNLENGNPEKRFLYFRKLKPQTNYLCFKKWKP